MTQRLSSPAPGTRISKEFGDGAELLFLFRYVEATSLAEAVSSDPVGSASIVPASSCFSRPRGLSRRNKVPTIVHAYGPSGGAG